MEAVRLVDGYCWHAAGHLRLHRLAVDELDACYDVIEQQRRLLAAVCGRS